jgi:23S rRNA (adenine2503-C2)-methyltransferase
MNPPPAWQRGAAISTAVGSSSVESASLALPSPIARFPEDWRRVLEQLGEPAYRAVQLFRWIHRRGVTTPAEMTDLTCGLRRRLAAGEPLEPGSLRHVRRSGDGTKKLLLEFGDGARVECVLIPMSSDSGQPTVDADAAATDDAEPSEPSERRVTLCVSTQYGCRMGCVFCASGQAGFRRHLTAAEIAYQVLVARGCLEPRERLRNIVFMGMGEPLDAYEHTARAIRLLMHPQGANMSPRRITVSTVGWVPGMRRLGVDFGGKLGLAVSLHAADDAIRSRLIPLNRRYPIGSILQALRDYPLPRRRRFTIEYALIANLNDGLSHARALAQRLRGLRTKINLIPLNPVPGCELRPPAPERVEAFRAALAEQGYSCFVRTRRGDALAAACGQLALSGRHEDRRPVRIRCGG